MGTIRAMEGTPQLLTDVKFSQHRRGYDPDEVDNFLERVSAAVAQLQDKLREATDRAEAADAQLAEARRLQAEAEARAAADPANLGDAPSPALDADEELKKVLLMAQRAADQAVSEANATANRTVTEARAKALTLLAEAESERDAMLAKARKKADVAAEDRAVELRERVAALEAVKIDLEADVATLDAHLAAEADRLREQLDAIRQGIDDPRGLRLVETPPLHDTPIPPLDEDEELRAAAGEDESAGGSLNSPVGDLVEGPDALAAVDRSTFTGIDESGDAGRPSETAGDESGHEEATLSESEPAESPSAESEGPSPVPGESVEVEEEGAVDPDAPQEAAIDLTGDAEESGTGGDQGEATQLFTPGEEPESESGSESRSDSGTGSVLGEPDAAADEAMRAFFEQDLDEDPTATSTPRPRFGRRR
jgi:DivIVA domain-containing protein